MQSEEWETLAAELSEACRNYKPTAGLEPSPARDAVLRKAEEVKLALTSPLHFTWMQLGNMYALMSLRTLLHLRVLERIPAFGKISVEALAHQSGMQWSLLERLLRTLVVTQFIAQDSDGRVSHTRLSRSYGVAMGPGMLFQTTYDDCLPGLGRFHQYMTERKSFTEPTDQAYNPFTWSRGQDGRTVWDIMAETRGLEVFQMALAAMDKKFPATGFFDFSALIPANEPDRVILVDIGGGIGSTLGTIIRSSPQLESEASRFVLEDLESPIKQAQHSGFLPAGVRTLAHDMFTEQPVQGK
ncbi:hypothetical protein F4861DRAFT_68633 [Xylaria intraflava]|nr:hypothetical protein F4861DRAFT_68633 [Xylaria intraflava]